MTREEIKQQYSIRDIAAQYGFYPNRAGFIHCPFHTGDKDASMKLYEKDFHCFGCGANGDIFAFVMRMDNVDFKKAFQSLGGTYDKPTFFSQLAVYRAQKSAEMKKKEERRIKEEMQLNHLLIGAYRRSVENSRPLSDTWCENYNKLQYQLYLHEEINKAR